MAKKQVAASRKKLQSAMEYLMTYGWAILIIAVVLGALFQLGVFNSSSFSPRAPPGACQVFRPSGPGTITNINLMGVCTGQLPQYVAKFNGQPNNYVKTSSAPPITSQIALCGWAYGINGAVAGGQYESFMISQAGGNSLSIHISTDGGIGGELNFGGGTTFTLNAWHFVCGEYTGSNYVGFIDGQQVFNTAGAQFYTTLQNIWFGGNSFGGFTSGLLANFQLYNTSLSANQVQALYLEGIGGAPMKLQNLVGWWPLNGNGNDYSGNNYNAQAYGSVAFTSQYGK